MSQSISITKIKNLAKTLRKKAKTGNDNALQRFKILPEFSDIGNLKFIIPLIKHRHALDVVTRERTIFSIYSDFVKTQPKKHKAIKQHSSENDFFKMSERIEKRQNDPIVIIKKNSF